MSNAIEEASDTSATTAVSSAKEVAVDKTARRYVRDQRSSEIQVLLAAGALIFLSQRGVEDMKNTSCRRA